LLIGELHPLFLGDEEEEDDDGDEEQEIWVSFSFFFFSIELLTKEAPLRE
jgi:hypothetical protein